MKAGPDCTLLRECGTHVMVEHNGDVFARDLFSGPEWKLGNVGDGRLTDMLNSDRQTRFGRMRTHLPEDCRKCRWLRLCRGGCTRERLNNPLDGNFSSFCAPFRVFFEHADERLKKLASDSKRGHSPSAGQDPSSRL